MPLKAILSKGKTATVYLAKNVAEHGFETVHGRTDFDELFLASLGGEDALEGLSVDDPNSGNSDLLIDFAINHFDGLDRLVFVHNELMNLAQFTKPLLMSDRAQVLVSIRHPMVQALSHVRSKQNLRSIDSDRRQPNTLITQLAQQAPDYVASDADILFSSYFLSICGFMIRAMNSSKPFIRYEDMVAQPSIVEQHISDLLEAPFTFQTHAVVNKHTESNYLKIMKEDLSDIFISWIEHCALKDPELAELFNFYDYDPRFSRVFV